MAESTIPTKNEQTEQAPATREETRYLVPPVDIYETDDGLNVIVDMPGVSKDNISVRVDNGILTLQGKVSGQTDTSQWRHREYVIPGFYRQFELGEAMDQEKISANLKHGVLCVHLPKAEAAKPKQVPIEIG